MNYINISHPDVNNGCGCRVTLWVAGCPHHCLECHNPESWNFNTGKEFTNETLNLLVKLVSMPVHSGITISGGEPLAQDKDVILNICKTIKSIPNKTIWIFTGYIYENLPYCEFLEYTDVLVDGLYDKNKRDVSLAFRGSSNQRLIDVQKSLKEGKVILYENS